MSVLCAFCKHPRAIHHPDFGMCEKCNNCPMFVDSDHINPKKSPKELGKKHIKGRDVHDPMKDKETLEQ